MRKAILHFISAFTLVIGLVACAGSATTPSAIADPLANTQWQLDSIDYMDDTTVKPDDGTKYTLEFDATGMVSMQVDCNRLRGAYKFDQPSGLEFGELMSTRAACPPESLYNRVSNDMSYVRSFVIKDGRLHLALMADGGIYNYSPMP
ncbi:MAG TPA: META domain-containing protein [Arenimonas sp.]|nr:META domain-containing protein [Arenimonas sp.]